MLNFIKKQIGTFLCWLDDAHPNKYYTDENGDLCCARCHRELT